MPYDLKGKNVLVTGGSRGLGAVLCHTFAAQGCNIAINYFNRVEAADEVASAVTSKYGVKAVVVKGDASLTAECKRTVEETIKALGGLDIVIANAGWTKFSNFTDLDALSEEEWDKCWAANVKAPLALLKAALPTFNANTEGGAMIITSSIAATSQAGSSMAYSVTKTAQVHLMKCLAKTQGPKVRVNAVLPGFLMTEWGLQYSPEAQQAAKDAAALKHETDLQDCADAYVMLAKNTSITGARIQVDAGLNIQGA
ncbi:short-chain dehydrogenase/reductase-like protein SDR [Delitschia confertaspora ATCC 74209]|uniref:Short-chain dehydrogenase/reductase-like protein SDR n=1 Tax=Delitschia confertaspora ATCC 74209 TaxID=1513339 RepID=A0A9P4N2G2_9PLEO|nr:short-chain dehydrogenase/reductase-like protein SDR [Delitschia confertaspora ATCC 74209]